MIKAAPPQDAGRRLSALRDLRMLDTSPEERFDRISTFAAQEFNAPIALITLVDQSRQWIKSCFGMEGAHEMQRDISFCGHALLLAETLVVPDARNDTRFAKIPWVSGKPHIRFYAGALLRLPRGEVVGTLCVMDSRPREFDRLDKAILGGLRDQVVHELLRGDRVIS